MNMYKGRSREDTKPHIYAMADGAFRNLIEEGENQSILVTLVSFTSMIRSPLMLRLVASQVLAKQRILKKSFNILQL